MIALDGLTKQAIVHGTSAGEADDDADADFKHLVVDDDDDESSTAAAKAAQGDGIEVDFNKLSYVVAGLRLKEASSIGAAATLTLSSLLLLAGVLLFFLAWSSSNVGARRTTSERQLESKTVEEKVMKALKFALTVLTLCRIPVLGQPAPFVPVTDQMLQNPDPADWLMWRRTLNSWGYSPLKQIDRQNVGRLRMVWTRGLGPGMQEGTPLVHNGVLYMPNPSDLLQALNGATGALLWEYRRQIPEDIGKHIPFPPINRNVAIYGNSIIDTSADDFAVAVDATTGKLAWENRILDYRELPAQGQISSIYRL